MNAQRPIVLNEHPLCHVYTVLVNGTKLVRITKYDIERWGWKRAIKRTGVKHAQVPD